MLYVMYKYFKNYEIYLPLFDYLDILDKLFIISSYFMVIGSQNIFKDILKDKI